MNTFYFALFVASLVVLPGTMAQAGKECNYAVKPILPCDDGFSCVLDPGTPAGKCGKCVKNPPPGKFGDKCNPRANPPLTCCQESKLICRDARGGGYGGADGFCGKPPGQKGDGCDMTTNPQTDCVAGLTCNGGKCSTPPGKLGDKCCKTELCDTGLECRYPTGSDQGICRFPRGKRGDDCNATINPPRDCMDGLFCDVTAGTGLGGAGKCCKNPGKVGDGCNMTTHPQDTCDTGLECRVASGAAPGAGGTCSYPLGKEGDNCNMSTNPPRACSDRLECAPRDATKPGADGTCEKPGAKGEGGECNATTNPPLICKYGYQCVGIPRPGECGKCHRG